MAKQLNVNLAFTADTSKAKASIADLSKSLQQVIKGPASSEALFDDKALKKAAAAAQELEKHLKKAYNTETGNLDLSRFSTSLKAAKKDLGSFYDDLTSAGDVGQKAFLNLAKAVTEAETPVIRINKKFQEMGTVLKNTIKWQISSSILHGFMGQISSAYKYAQDLNASLNDIRIVSGQSADQMARFAKQANLAAKELDTTTNRYAKASLIYYQQGLSDQEVTERTNITMKMANVSKESAEVVSNQMTAVWNNFDDGSKSLEYYADVMTALGAATASSTAEISQGLDKFAAIAETVGLSYEYSTAALATVTAKTRQSADVVGTAFKTMFARIQGLKLGETLEDGTDLNKYSEALASVGISIKDENGQLKEMDYILDEMAAKWKTLEKDEKAALAQTVAGTRQYTQLMALMNNWDFMQQNLEVVKGSEGALQEQADIYAESWEAASNNVRASMESIYSAMLDDSFFISLLNTLDKTLESVQGLIEGFGGLKGIFLSAGSLFLTLYAKKMPQTLENLKNNFLVVTGQSEKLTRQVQEQTAKKLQEVQMDPTLSAKEKIQSEGMIKILGLQQKYSLQMKNMSLSEREAAESKIKLVKSMYEESAELKEQEEDLSIRIKSTKELLALEAKRNAANQFEKKKSRSESKENNLKSEINRVNQEIQAKNAEARTLVSGKRNRNKEKMASGVKAQISGLEKRLSILKDNLQQAQLETQRIENEENPENGHLEINQEIDKATKSYTELTRKMDLFEQTDSRLGSQIKVWEEYGKTIGNSSKEMGQLKKKGLEYLKVMEKNIASETEEKNGKMVLTKKSSENLEFLKDAKIQLSNSIDLSNPTKAVEDFHKIFTKLKDDLDLSSQVADIGKDMELLDESLLKIGIPPEKVEQLKNNIHDLVDSQLKSEGIDQNKSNFDEESFGPKDFSASTAFTHLTSSVMGAYSALSSFKNAFDVFTDEASTGLEKMGAAISVVTSTSQAFNAISQLSNEVIKSKTIATGLATIANKFLAKSEEKVTAATITAKTAMWEITLIAAAVSAAIYAIVKVCDWLIISEKEASESIANANKAFEEQSQKVEELKNSLVGVKEQIEELQKKGKLSLTDANELKKLQAQEQSLKTQLAYEEALRKEKEKEADKTFEKNGFKNVPSKTTVSAIDFEKSAQSKSPFPEYKDISNVQDFKQYQKELADKFGASSQIYQDSFLSLNQLEMKRSENQKWAEENPEDFQNLIKSFQKYYDKYKDDPAKEDEIQEKMAEYNNLIKDVYSGETFENIFSNMDELFVSSYGGKDQKYSKDTTEEEIINSLPNDFIDQLALQGITPKDYANHIKEGLKNGGVLFAEEGKKAITSTEINKEIKDSQDLKKLKIGDTIDPEKFNELDNGLKGFFTLTSDGTYQLTKKAEDLAQAVKALNEQKILGSIHENLQQKEKNDVEIEKVKSVLDYEIPNGSSGENGQTGETNPLDLAEYSKIEVGENGDLVPSDGDQVTQPVEEFIKFLNDAKNLGLEDLVLSLRTDLENSLITEDQFKERLYEIQTEAQKKLEGLKKSNALIEQENTQFLSQLNSSVNTFEELIEKEASGEFSKREDEIPVLQLLSSKYGLTDEMSQYEEAFHKKDSAYKNYQYQVKKDLGSPNSDPTEMIRLEDEVFDAEKELKNADDLLKSRLMLAESAENYSLDLEELKIQSDQIAKTYNLDQKASAKLAIENQRMNRGVSTLNKNWEKYQKEIKDSKKDTLDYAKSTKELTSIVADLTGASKDLKLDSSFFSEASGNMNLLEKAAKGDEKAIWELGVAVVKSQVEIADFNQETVNAAKGEGLLGSLFNEEEFENTKNRILEGLDAFWGQIESGALKVGDKATAESIFGEKWIEDLNKYAAATGMTVEEMQKYLNSLGVDGEVGMETVTMTQQKPIVETSVAITEYADENKQIPSKYTTSSRVIGYEPIEEKIPVAKIGKDTEFKIMGNGNVSPSSTSGSSKSSGSGSGNKPKKTTVSKKDDVVKRYKEVDDKLRDISDELSDINKKTDRLYGGKKIAEMKKVNKVLEQEVNLLRQKKNEAEKNLIDDKNAMEDAGEKAGVNIQVDSKTGNVTNYTEEMTKLFNQLKDLQEKANLDGNATEEEEKSIQNLQDTINNLKDAISQYDETHELIQDLENQIDDKFNEWQDNNYEQLHYKLELNLDINDMELKKTDYYLNKMSDDFYSMAESAELIVSKASQFESKLETTKNSFEVLEESYANNEISQEKFIEGLKESYDIVLENLEALNDLDKQMMNYYEDTLSMASEELGKYTDRLSHLTAVLDHYKSIVTLLNGESDYKRIGIILEGQAKSLENEMKVSQDYYAALLKQKSKIEKSLSGAKNESAKELFQKELDTITQAVNEAQEDMLSKTEAWAESMKAILENTISKAGKDLENAFTNNIGFESLMSSLDRLNTYQDEYLTKTNQVYETQKLMRKAQQDANKMEGSFAKKKIKNFLDETSKLQEKNQMSKLDLEIQQAKYELLLAQIALEDAQETKDTVRLQRDSEGNFGYVYTADEEKISEKEQALADAENKLYNIGLEATNSYGQKQLELQQQLAEDLQTLNEKRNAGEFQSEKQYQEEKNRILSEYQNLFIAYSNNYTTALGIDANIQKEAWISAYDEMINVTNNWKTSTEDYLTQCESAYEDWRKVVEQENEIVKDILSNTKDSVADITNESDLLKQTIIKDVIPTIDEELTSVQDLTFAYVNQKDTIQDVITKYSELITKIKEAILVQSQMDNSSSPPSPPLSESASTDSTDLEDNNLESNDNRKNFNPKEVAADIWLNSAGQQHWGYGSQRKANIDSVYGEGAYEKVQQEINKHGANGDLYKEFHNKKDILEKTRMKSGGYTGSWGNYGKLAILDEKELVLNQNDTANLLLTIDLLRDFSKNIDFKASQALNSLASFDFIRNNPVNSMPLSQPINQEINISADFPDVQDHYEIEQAFSNLINTASQYINE